MIFLLRVQRGVDRKKKGNKARYTSKICFPFSKWLWVKNNGYPKTPIVKREKIDQNLWFLGVFFLTHSQSNVLLAFSRVVRLVLLVLRTATAASDTRICFRSLEKKSLKCRLGPKIQKMKNHQKSKTRDTKWLFCSIPQTQSYQADR